MKIDLVIKNYRRFGEASPARLTVGDGMVALVGANNSGKSSLLKMVYELRDAFRLFGSDYSSNMWRIVLQGGNIQFSWPREIVDKLEAFSRTTVNPLSVDVTIDSTTPPTRFQLIVGRKTDGGYGVASLNLPEFPYDSSRVEPIKGKEWDFLLGSQDTFSVEELAKACKVLAEAVYIPAFRNTVNTGAGTFYDVAVGSGFVGAWRQFQAGDSNTTKRAISKVQEELRRLFGYENLRVRDSADASKMLVDVNGEPFQLNELGAGFSHFLLTLGSIAIKSPSIVFIDEPELGLHPSLQIEFLKTVASFSRFGVVFATHNYGLARTMGERIYLIHANGPVSEVILHEEFPDLSVFLGELGFSAYRDLGYDQILLVEGSTELKTIQAFLRKLGKDGRVVMVPLHGRQLITGDRDAQLQELKRLAPKVTAIIDSELESPTALLEPNRQAFVEACKKADINVKVLERRAMENYFTENAIQTAFNGQYHALGPYEKLTGMWNKNDNWRIAESMSKAELEATDLGKYLASL